jgi:hypothetical protein
VKLNEKIDAKALNHQLLKVNLKLKIRLIHYILMSLNLFIKMALDLINMNYIQKHNIKKLCLAMMIKIIFVIIILIHILLGIIKLSKLL